MPGAGGDLGGRLAGGQPQGQGGVAQVVGPADQRGGGQGGAEGRGAGGVTGAAVGAFVQDPAAGGAEQPPAGGGAAGLNVTAQEGDELRRDGHSPDGSLGTELEAAVLVRGAVAGPCAAGTRA